MRIATTVAALLFVLQACSTTSKPTESPYQQPNSLMGGEITKRIEQIPYQHRDELLQNLVWLVQQGEQSIPASLDGLRSSEPKVRSSCAWVLGRLHDRRTIPNLQSAMRDNEMGVRLEVARSLVAMGDLNQCPMLIEGLDSDKKEVRYMCHETMKAATGRDFGYDHLNQNENEMRLSVLRWRQWWGEYSGDARFAQSYQNQYHLDPAVAAPGGETKPTPDGQTPNPQEQEPQTQGAGTQGTGPQGTGSKTDAAKTGGTTNSTNSTTGNGGSTGSTGSTTGSTSGTDNSTTGSKTSGTGSTSTTGNTTNSTTNSTTGSTGTTNSKTGSSSTGSTTGTTTGTTGTSGTTGTNGTTGPNGTTGTPNSSRPNGG